MIQLRYGGVCHSWCLLLTFLKFFMFIFQSLITPPLLCQNIQNFPSKKQKRRICSFSWIYRKLWFLLITQFRGNCMSMCEIWNILRLSCVILYGLSGDKFYFFLNFLHIWCIKILVHSYVWYVHEVHVRLCNILCTGCPLYHVIGHGYHYGMSLQMQVFCARSCHAQWHNKRDTLDSGGFQTKCTHTSFVSFF